MSELDALAKEIAPVIRRFVDEATAPLRAEIAELKARPVTVPKDGVSIAGCLKDADGVLILTLTDGRTLKTEIRDGAPGRDAEPLNVEKIRPIVLDVIASSPTTVEVNEVDPELVRAMVAEGIEKGLAALPKAKDGVGLAGALLTRDGALMLTLTDGSTRDVGKVVGTDADVVAIEARIKALVDAIPRPKDGLDAVGFDDLDLVEKPEGVFLEFTRGEKVKSFRLPVVIDRGVYKEGSVYRKGDGVTWAGSFWIAQGDANGRPDAGNDEWRLAVKKGRDGKDAQSKPEAVKL